MLPTTLPLATGMLNSVVPFSSLLAAPTLPLAMTPVSPAPLPIKIPPVETMLPVTLTASVPVPWDTKLPPAGLVITTAVALALMVAPPRSIVVPLR